MATNLIIKDNDNMHGSWSPKPGRLNIGDYGEFGETALYNKFYMAINCKLYKSQNNGMAENIFKSTWNNNDSKGFVMTHDSGGKASLNFFGTDYYYNDQYRNLETDFTHIIRFGTNGQVSIGTKTPEDNYKLTVNGGIYAKDVYIDGTTKTNGKIEAKEVEVMLSVPRSDYVLKRITISGH